MLVQSLRHLLHSAMVWIPLRVRERRKNPSLCVLQGEKIQLNPKRRLEAMGNRCVWDDIME